MTACPAGRVLTYIVGVEAWYYPAMPEGLNDAYVSVMLVDALPDGTPKPDGGSDWEFQVKDHPDIDAVRVEVFHDAWAAFANCPDLFAALGSLGTAVGDGRPTPTLGDVRAVLDALGAVDVTARVSPYAAP